MPDITDDLLFRGVQKYEEELRSWEWRYGKTPQFTLSLFTDSITVEHGIITDSISNKKLIGTPLLQNPVETYLGFKVKPILEYDTTLYLAKAKAYMCEVPDGIDPKLVMLQALVVGTLFIALTYPMYALMVEDEPSSATKEHTSAIV